MPALTINGVEVPVVSVERSDASIGETSRTLDGVSEKTERARMVAWTIETAPMATAEAQALSGLLRGLGHYWDTSPASATTGMTSSKALSPASAVGVSKQSDTTNPNGSTGYLHATGDVKYSTSFDPARWTFGEWRYGLEGWRHYVITPTQTWKHGVLVTEPKRAYVSDGTDGNTAGHLILRPPRDAYGATTRLSSTAYSLNQYVIDTTNNNYVWRCITAGTTAATSPWVGLPWQSTNTTDGTVVWQAVDRTNRLWSDYFILPFVAPSSWVSQIYAFHTANRWPVLPRLTVNGDIVGSVVVTALGHVESSKVSTAVTGAVMESLTFTLLETV